LQGKRIACVSITDWQPPRTATAERRLSRNCSLKEPCLYQVRAARGGGTGGEYEISQTELALRANSNVIQEGSNRMGRAIQMMSILGVGDWISRFSCDDFPLFTM